MSSTTLVGIFEDHHQARQASQRLQQAGVPEQAILVSEEEGAISRFFSNLFGASDAPDTRQYSEAVRRGHAVVTVQVEEDERVDAVTQLLEDSGAVDVNERIEAWKSSGFEAMPPAVGGAAGAPGDLLSNDVLGMAETRQMGAANADDHQALKASEEELEIAKVSLRQSLRVRRYEAAPAALNMAQGRAGPERRMGGVRDYSGVERRMAA